MEIDQSRIDDLVARPSESLNVEFKRWINPAEPVVDQEAHHRVIEKAWQAFIVSLKKGLPPAHADFITNLCRCPA